MDRISKHKVIKVTIGIHLFAFLMGIRGEFTELWVRVLLACVAGGIFGWVLFKCQKRSE